MCRCCGVPFGPGPDAPAPPTGRQGFQLTSLTRGRGPERRFSPLRHGRGVWQAAKDRPWRTPAHASRRRPQTPVSTRHRAAGCATTPCPLFRWPCGDRRAVHVLMRGEEEPRQLPPEAGKAGVSRLATSDLWGRAGAARRERGCALPARMRAATPRRPDCPRKGRGRSRITEPRVVA